MKDENKNEIDTDASAAGAAAAASAAAFVFTTVFTVVATVAAAAASVSEEKDSWTLNIINVLVFGKLVCIHTCPNRSGWVPTGPNTRKKIKKLAKAFM